MHPFSRHSGIIAYAHKINLGGMGFNRIGLHHAFWSVLIFLVSIHGCEVFEDPTSTETEVSTARSALLIDLARYVYYPSYLQAYESLEALEVALNEWDGASDSSSLQTARTAWQYSMRLWQRTEVMQVGPAAQSGTRIGGEDRRDLIYAYPLHNPCRVDQELLAGRYQEEDWALRATINAKGLDALEYLLFASSDENLCPDSIAMNRDGTWVTWRDQPGVLPQARKTLSLAILGDLQVQMKALVDTWSEGGKTRSAFSEGSAPFADQRQALDEVYASLYYLDQVAKDLKLALPLGLSMDCAQAPCLEDLELYHSKMSREALIANLQGLLWIWSGGSPDQRDVHHGFDDLLNDEGAPELAESLIMQTEGLIEAFQARQDDLATLLETEPAWVEARHQELRTLTDLIKSQLATVLNLSVPHEGAGDND